MTDAPLRWGIISAGRIAHDFCVGLRSDPNKGHEIVAIAARDLKRAEKFAKENDILQAYDKYEDIAKNPSIEVVYVAVINSEHIDCVKMLLNFNKNILCEKPLGMNVRETKEMLQLAKQKNVFFMEGMWARFFPVQVRMREELKNKTIGDVKLVMSTFGQTAGSDMERLFKRELGGGAIMDMGVYTIAFSQMVYGEMPIKITATGFLNDHGCDELDSVTFEYSDKRMAVFQVTFKTEVPNEAIVCGTKGIIKVVKHGGQPLADLLSFNKYLYRILNINAPFYCSDSMTIKDKVVEFPFPHPVDKSKYKNGVGFMYEANEVKRCIREGLKESPIYSHQETLIVATLIEECRKLLGVKFAQDEIK